MTKTRLILVRHGQTEWNATGRFQGQADVPLDAHGRAQAEQLVAAWGEITPTVCYASDLSRAVETAELLGGGLPVVQDRRLREIHVGEWEGRTPADVQAENPWFLDALRRRQDFRRSASGETGEETAERIAEALVDFGERHRGETVLVVGHGFALRVGMAKVLGLSFEQSFSLAGLWNCSWSILEQGSGWRLVHYNQVAPGHSGELKSVNAP